MSWTDDYLRKYYVATQVFGSSTLVFDMDTETFSLKKEASTMDKKTIEALHKSIAHWNDICYGMEDDYFSGNCALCGAHSKGISECEDCPVQKADGMKCGTFAGSSTWGRYYDAHGGNNGFCTVDSADAAEAMLELLVSLLPDDGRRNNYEVGVDQSFGTSKNAGINWCLRGGVLNISGITGITTDGRNAFPQAKKVWEKVFEYQVCGPIPEMPMFGATERRIWVDAGWHRWTSRLHRFTNPYKDQDDNCPTCGQKIPKKVTKYRVVYEGRDGLEISISSYESGEDFENYNSDYKCVSLILETAKEFDCE